MTSFEGETAASVSDALAEAADPATVIADEAAESLDETTAAEAVEDAPLGTATLRRSPRLTATLRRARRIDVAADAATDSDVAADAATEDEDEDPAVALKKELRLRPGDWYVIHSYAGYENKVKANLETRVQNLDVGDYIFQVEVPTEEVTEIKNGQRKQVNRKVLPGYILVRMELNDESWGAVRNTPGVTGFVGATSRPSPLSLDDVVKFLLPPGAAKKPAKSTAGRRLVRGHAGASGDPGRLRGRRVGHRHGRPVRDVARVDQRGQRRTTEAQGARVHLRPRDTCRTDLQPGRQDLRLALDAERTQRTQPWPRRRKSSG